MESFDKSKEQQDMASILIANLEEFLRTEKNQKARENYEKRILELKQQWFKVKK